MGSKLVRTACLAGGVAGTCWLAVRGSLTLDLGIGRRTRELGPLDTHVEASPETVFDVISAPYLGRTPQAMREKLEVVERGSDMVLAAHFTPTALGRATTLETVRFERPHRVSFRLVRGPVPYVTESFELRPGAGGTDFAYRGELGTDGWALGARWGEAVARVWERTVEDSMASVRAEAERRDRP